MVSCKRVFGRWIVTVCDRQAEFDTFRDALTFIKYVRGYF